MNRNRLILALLGSAMTLVFVFFCAYYVYLIATRPGFKNNPAEILAWAEKYQQAQNACFESEKTLSALVGGEGPGPHSFPTIESMKQNLPAALELSRTPEFINTFYERYVLKQSDLSSRLILNDLRRLFQNFKCYKLQSIAVGSALATLTKKPTDPTIRVWLSKTYGPFLKHQLKASMFEKFSLYQEGKQFSDFVLLKIILLPGSHMKELKPLPFEIIRDLAQLNIEEDKIDSPLRSFSHPARAMRYLFLRLSRTLHLPPVMLESETEASQKLAFERKKVAESMRLARLLENLIRQSSLARYYH